MRSCPHCFSEYVTDVEFCGLDGERILETDNDPLIGKTLDRYEVLERLGHGGMSVVYRARHSVIGKEYALKVPYGEIALDRHFAERLRREAQVIAELDHPNIVRVYDFANIDGGSSFILMELLRGRTLERAIREDGRMKAKTAGRLIHQIALGLSAAHRAGFVHRDLKPGNVMLIGERGEETAKILDFGLVHVPDRGSAEDTARARLTETGIAVGTPVYMAPEQMRGEPATTGSDIYSLGAVLFEMLSGLPPYIGSLPDILVKQTQPPPPAPPSGGLENLVNSMLERTPSKRPPVDEIIAAIERLDLSSSDTRAVEPKATQSLRVPVPAKQQVPPKVEKRHRYAAGVVLFLVLIGIAVWLHDNPQRAENIDQHYEKAVDSASEKIQQVDRKIVTEMAELGQRLEQRKGCSARALSNRVSEVLELIDRAQRQHRISKNAGIERRARALKRALDDKDINDARCRSLERSVLKIERDLVRVTRSVRS